MANIVLITVANEYQKTYLEEYIKKQKDNHIDIYVKYEFLIIISANGSGTAVISAINFKNKNRYKKLLLINSGGKSKRTKMFSKKGKVFIPIPAKDDNNKIVLDELLNYYHTINNKIVTNGLLVFAADVIIDNFSLKEEINDTSAITTLANSKIGKNHGVFLEEDGIISKFLHKQSLDVLKKENAVINDKVLIDTGIYFIKDDCLELINNQYHERYDRDDFIDFYGEIIPFIHERVAIKIIEIKQGVFYHLGNYKYYRDYIFSKNNVKNNFFIHKSTIDKNVSIGNSSLVFNCKLNDINIPDNTIVYEEDGEVKIEEII